MILNKLNQKHIRKFQCKYAPFPKTRTACDAINREISRARVTKNHCHACLILKKIKPNLILCGGSSEYKKPRLDTLDFYSENCFSVLAHLLSCIGNETDPNCQVSYAQILSPRDTFFEDQKCLSETSFVPTVTVCRLSVEPLK